MAAWGTLGCVQTFSPPLTNSTGLGTGKMAAILKRFSRRRASTDAPPVAERMKNIDALFFNDDDKPPFFEDEGEEATIGKARTPLRKEGVGLLDDEPERAETDFYNGDKFVGDVANSKRHGHGVYYYDSGDKYTGGWHEGKQCGHGVYVYANGDRYVGEWSGGKHDGEGTYHFKSGKVFQGSYRQGQPMGHGVCSVSQSVEPVTTTLRGNTVGRTTGAHKPDTTTYRTQLPDYYLPDTTTGHYYLPDTTTGHYYRTLLPDTTTYRTLLVPDTTTQEPTGLNVTANVTAT